VARYVQDGKNENKEIRDIGDFYHLRSGPKAYDEDGREDEEGVLGHDMIGVV
jgi:hypothetical protein